MTVTMVPNDQPASGSVTPGEDGDAVTLNIPKTRCDASETNYSGDASVAGSTGYESTAAALNDILRRLAALEPSIHIATLTADPDSVKKGTGGSVKLSWTYAAGSTEPAKQELTGVSGLPAISASERSATVTLDGSGDATIVLKSVDANGKEDSRTVSVKAVDVQQQNVYFGLAAGGEVNEALVKGLQFSESRTNPYIDEATVTLGDDADGTPLFAWFACPKDMVTFNKVNGQANLHFYCGGFQDNSFLENASETTVGSTVYVVFKSGNELAQYEGDNVSITVKKG